jgi:hypothetical protein
VGPPPRGSHVSKTALQNHRMAEMNGFKSSMAEDFWFCRLMVKTKLLE